MSDSAWWEGGDADAEPATTRTERELVPEGTHVFEVKAVAESVAELEIRLAHGDSRYGWVFCRLAKGRGWARKLAAEFAEALGVSPRDWNRVIESGELVGRSVEARVYHRLAGERTYVNVAKFLRPQSPAPVVERAVAPPAGRAPVRRPATKSQAADAAGKTPADDIPF